MSNYINQRKNNILVDYRLFIIFLFTVPLYLFNNTYISIIGSISIISIFFMGVYNIFFKGDKIRITNTWVHFFILCFYNTFMLIRTPTWKGIYTFTLQIILLLFICLLSSENLNRKVINSIFRHGKVLYVILLIPSIVVILNGGGSAVLTFSNYYSPVLYKFMLPCTFFFLPNKERKFLKILFFSLVFLFMGERTSAVVVFIIYLIYLMLGKLKNSRLFKLFFVVVFFSIIGFTYLYVQLQYMEIGYLLNLLSREYTNGNFFSGRNVIWEIAFQYLSESLLFGYGLDNQILLTSGITKSVHNTYLHLLLQGGFLGLSIFFMFLYSIWKRYFRYLNDDIVRMSAAYFVGILIFINFEVSLIGNSVGLGIFLWLIIGLGLIQGNNSIRLKKMKYK